MKKINLNKIKFPKLKLPKIKKIKKNPNEPLKYKLNKEKLKQRIPLAIGILLIIITLIVFPNSGFHHLLFSLYF